jgi:hypothetical protein
MSAERKSAPLMVALLNVPPAMFAFEKFARERLDLLNEDPTRVADEKFAEEARALSNTAPVKSAPEKFVPLKFALRKFFRASDMLLKSHPARLIG